MKQAIILIFVFISLRAVIYCQPRNCSSVLRYFNCITLYHILKLVVHIGLFCNCLCVSVINFNMRVYLTGEMKKESRII
jgi:hypothetical protein